MKKIIVATLALLLVSLTACDASVSGSGPRPKDEPAFRSAPATGLLRAARGPRIPPRPKVWFTRLGGSGPDVRRAIADLKAVKLWGRLTEHLYRIEVLVRPGAGAVPEDGHLADARFVKTLVGSGTFDYPLGSYCIIRFYPTAMLADLARWNAYYSRGLTALVPPTGRQFWASIIGHELAHCPRRGTKPSPEPIALAWERRVRAALVAAGIE